MLLDYRQLGGPLKKRLLLWAAALLFAAAAVFFAKFQSRNSHDESLPEGQFEKIFAEDKARLRDGGNEDEVRKSIERVSWHADSEVKELILKYSKSSSAKLRSGCAEAAGSFVEDENFFKIIRQSLADRDEEVRVAALKGLSRHSGEPSLSLVSEYLGHTGLTPSELFEGHLTLLKISADSATHRRALTALVKMADDTLAKGDPAWMLELFLFAPGEAVMLERARRISGESRDPRLVMRANQYLSASSRRAKKN
jgi:hypothetical protein